MNKKLLFILPAMFLIASTSKGCKGEGAKARDDAGNQITRIYEIQTLDGEQIEIEADRCYVDQNDGIDQDAVLGSNSAVMIDPSGGVEYFLVICKSYLDHSGYFLHEEVVYARRVKSLFLKEIKTVPVGSEVE